MDFYFLFWLYSKFISLSLSCLTVHKPRRSVGQESEGRRLLSHVGSRHVQGHLFRGPLAGLLLRHASDLLDIHHEFQFSLTVTTCAIVYHKIPSTSQALATYLKEDHSCDIKRLRVWQAPHATRKSPLLLPGHTTFIDYCDTYSALDISGILIPIILYSRRDKACIPQQHARTTTKIRFRSCFSVTS